jgi:predicted DNA-binding protein
MIRTPENDAWLCFRLPSESRDRLDEIASAQERSRSELLREVVEIVVADFTRQRQPDRPAPDPA